MQLRLSVHVSGQAKRAERTPFARAASEPDVARASTRARVARAAVRAYGRLMRAVGGHCDVAPRWPCRTRACSYGSIGVSAGFGSVHSEEHGRQREKNVRSEQSPPVKPLKHAQMQPLPCVVQTPRPLHAFGQQLPVTRVTRVTSSRSSESAIKRIVTSSGLFLLLRLD